MAQDVVASLLETGHVLLSRESKATLLFVVAVSVILHPLLALAHELGHASAVRARGLVLHEVRIPLVHVSFSPTRIKLHRGLTDPGVVYDATVAGPKDHLVIALAGPAASALLALVTAILCTGFAPTSGVAHVLLLLTGDGVVAVLVNLVPLGRPGRSACNDGRIAQLAWRAQRQRDEIAAS